MLQGVDPYAAHQRGDHSYRILAQYPNYPVSGLILLWPYAAFEWPTARLLWALSNVVLTIVCVWLLTGPLAGPRADEPPAASRARPLAGWNKHSWILLGLLLCSFSWRNGLAKGQHGIFSLCFVLVAVLLSQRHAIGSTLALAASWLKPTLGLPFSIVVATTRRGLAILAGAVGVHVVLTLLAAFWLGSGVVELLLGPVQTGMTTTPAGRVDVFRIATDLGIGTRVVPALAALALGALGFLAIRRSSDPLSALSTLSLVAVMSAFHSGYDFVVLAVPLAYALREGFRHPRSLYLTAPVLLVWFVDRPWLELYGGLVERVGGLGAGLKAKVARNLISFGQCAAAYEGKRVAE